MLHEYFDNFYIVYIDDILIYNKNKKKHIKYIRLILIRFRKIKFQIDMQKCLFEIIKIKYLDLIIIIKKN